MRIRVQPRHAAPVGALDPMEAPARRPGSRTTSRSTAATAWGSGARQQPGTVRRSRRDRTSPLRSGVVAQLPDPDAERRLSVREATVAGARLACAAARQPPGRRPPRRSPRARRGARHVDRSPGLRTQDAMASADSWARAAGPPRPLLGGIQPHPHPVALAPPVHLVRGADERRQGAPPPPRGWRRRSPGASPGRPPTRRCRRRSPGGWRRGRGPCWAA